MYYEEFLFPQIPNRNPKTSARLCTISALVLLMPNLSSFPIYQPATVANTMLIKPKQKKAAHSTIVAASKVPTTKAGNKIPSLLSDDEEELDEKEVDNNGTDYAVS